MDSYFLVGDTALIALILYVYTTGLQRRLSIIKQQIRRLSRSNSVGDGSALRRASVIALAIIARWTQEGGS